MAEFPWYPKFPAEYLGDTKGRLGLAEHGAYTLLMDHAYLNNGLIECDFDAIAYANAFGAHTQVYRLVGCETDLDRWAVDTVLKKFWYRCEGGYRQKRIESELAKRAEKGKKARESAEIRWAKERAELAAKNASGDDADGDANAYANASKTDANHNHNQSQNVKTGLVLEVQNSASIAGGSGGNGPPAAPAAKKTPKKKPTHPLPADWKPTDHHREKAAELGLKLDREAEKFRAHAEAKDRRFANENAAFTMWLLNAVDMNGGRNGGGPAPVAPKKYCTVHQGIALDVKGRCSVCEREKPARERA